MITFLKTIIGIEKTNDLRLILCGQAWFMWIRAPVLQSENREELDQSLENNDWCWPASLEAFLGSLALIFSFLFFFITPSFFSLHPPTHPSTGFPGLGKKLTAAKLTAWACSPARRTGIMFLEKWQMKNCLGYTNTQIYCVKVWGSGPFCSRSCKNIWNMAEPLLRGWPVVKHNDGGLVIKKWQ